MMRRLAALQGVVVTNMMLLKQAPTHHPESPLPHPPHSRHMPFALAGHPSDDPHHVCCLLLPDPPEGGVNAQGGGVNR